MDGLYDECLRESLILGIFLMEGESFCGLAEMYGLRNAIHKVSIGYRLAEPYWSKGIASETVSLMTGYLFRKAGIKIITASTMIENKASAKVLKKNGFTLIYHNVAEDWGYEAPTATDKWLLLSLQEQGDTPGTESRFLRRCGFQAGSLPPPVISEAQHCDIVKLFRVPHIILYRIIHATDKVLRNCPGVPVQRIGDSFLPEHFAFRDVRLRYAVGINKQAVTRLQFEFSAPDLCFFRAPRKRSCGYRIISKSLPVLCSSAFFTLVLRFATFGLFFQRFGRFHFPSGKLVNAWCSTSGKPYFSFPSAFFPRLIEWSHHSQINPPQKRSSLQKALW